METCVAQYFAGTPLSSPSWGGRNDGAELHEDTADPHLVPESGHTVLHPTRFYISFELLVSGPFNGQHRVESGGLSRAR